MTASESLQAVAFLIAATILEVNEDAIIRIALHNYGGIASLRIALFLLGAVLVFGYGTFLNLAPLEFGNVVGLYIATLFIVWQVINFVAFRVTPTLPIMVGGALVVGGGALITFWKPT